MVLDFSTKKNVKFWLILLNPYNIVKTILLKIYINLDFNSYFHYCTRFNELQ